MNPVRREQRTESAGAVFDRLLDEDIRLAAHARVPVLVTSENHEHRDMCARLIHATGDCVLGPFVKYSSNGNGGDRVQASTHPAGDLFDGARLRQQHEHARGGTLFIDDVAALTPSAQAQLLALLGERLRPQLSAPRLRHSVRIIAGSSRHLHRVCPTGAFCEPLFYRLNVIHLVLTY